MSKPQTLEEVEALLKAAPSTRDRMRACTKRCDTPDSEHCRRASWSVKCDCLCHPPAVHLTSEDIHAFSEQRRIGQDIAEEVRKERFG